MNPKYSFVLPVFNGELTLGSTLDSIFRQTGSSYEVIVVDNNSTDGTRDVCRRFPDVLVVDCTEQGRSSARNRGAGFAKGEWLLFVDCDVVLAPDWLREIEATLRVLPVDLLATAIVPSAEDIASALDRYRHFFADHKSHGTFLSLQKFFGVRPVVNTAACVCRKMSFEVVQGFDVSLSRSEDLDLSLRMFFLGFTLGGSTAVRSTVRFVAPHRLRSYLVRHLEIAFETRYPSLPFRRAFYALTKKAWARGEGGVLGMIVLVETLRLLGYVLSMARRAFGGQRHSPSLKRSDAQKKFRFSFVDQGKFYSLDSRLHLIFIDEKVHCLDSTFSDREVRREEGTMLRKLLRGEELVAVERGELLASGFFV
jgi:glycosyltransferase involved in cell wall biosynthesis